MAVTYSESERLCIECNMCCNGMIFGKVSITESECERLDKGENILREGEQIFLRQSCGYLGDNGACGKYELRPQKCRDYSCDLLDKLEAKDVDYEFASQIIEQAKGFQKKTISACSTAMPEGQSFAQFTDASDAFLALVQAVSQDGDAASLKFQEAVFHWNVTKHYMRKHFEQMYCPDPVKET